MSLRVSALDYLGTIAARLRKDEVNSKSDATSLDNIVEFLMAHTTGDDLLYDGKRRRMHELSDDERQRLLQTALVDYLDVMIQERDEVYNVSYPRAHRSRLIFLFATVCTRVHCDAMVQGHSDRARATGEGAREAREGWRGRDRCAHAARF